MVKIKDLVEEVLKGYTDDSCITPDTELKVNAYELRDAIANKINSDWIDESELDDIETDLMNAESSIEGARRTIKTLMEES